MLFRLRRKVVRKKRIYSSTNKAGDSGVKVGKIPHRGLAEAALHPVFRPPLPNMARDHRIANCLPSSSTSESGHQGSHRQLLSVLHFHILPGIASSPNCLPPSTSESCQGSSHRQPSSVSGIGGAFQGHVPGPRPYLLYF